MRVQALSKNLFLHLLTLLFLFLLFFASCKKTDSELSIPTEKFFYVNSILPNPVIRSINELKRQNALTGFIEAFAKNNGYPKWDKSIVEYKKQNTSANFTHASSAEGSYDTLVFTPVVREGEDYVSSFILAHVGDTVQLNLYREKDYDFHPDGAVDSTFVTAERVSLELMELNKEVYGYSKFEIKDSLLFRGAFPATIESGKRTIELTNILYSTGKVYWAITCFVKGSNFLRGDTTETSSDQGGGGDCWEWSFEIEDPYSWPPDTPSGPECPCGGGGGGGSNPTTPPPSNCTGNPDCTRGTKIIEGREPCGNCGPGPIIVIVTEPIAYGSNVVDDFDELLNFDDWKNTIDDTGLDNFPCLKSIWTSLKSSTEFYSVMKNFTGVNPTGHVRFTTDPNPNNGDFAITTPSVARQSSTIDFSVGRLAHASKSMAVITFIHEMLHADFDRILMRMDKDPSVRDTYEKVIKTLGHLKRPDLTDHQFMADEYLPFLKAALMEVDAALGLSPHYLPNTTTIDPDYYDALCWSGLQETDDYLALPQTQRTKYDSILSRESYQGAGCN